MKKKESKPEDGQAKIDELTDMLKRTQADFINYKNRVEKESKQVLDLNNAELVKQLLPVLDSFELALKAKSDPENFRQGMEMVYAQLFDILKQQGLDIIKAEGKFDPYLHEVLMKSKSDMEEDSVIEVLQRGYTFKGRIIRHAKVKIAGR